MEEKKVQEFCAIPKEVAQKKLQDFVAKHKEIFDEYNMWATTVGTPVIMKPVENEVPEETVGKTEE